MSIKFENDGTIRCNTVKYNYKQARNLISNGDFEISTAQSWTLSNCTSYTSYLTSYRSYRCLQLGYGSQKISMSTQNMPTPIPGHKYYGGLMWKVPGSNFSADDNRFEWYIADAPDGHLVFANKDHATSGQWVKLSSIQSISIVRKGQWVLRNFLVNSSTTSYCDRLIIVDLTDTFGAGNEPDKAWCDENILQWGQCLSTADLSPNVSDANIHTAWSTSQLVHGNYPHLSLDNNWEPRDYMYHLAVDPSYNSGFMTSDSTKYLAKGNYYYASLDIYVSVAPFDISWQFPSQTGGVLEEIRTVNAPDFNSGGGMQHWQRVSFYVQRNSWSSGYYFQSIHFKNTYAPGDGRVTNIQLCNVNSFVNNSNTYSFLPVTIGSISDVNKAFMDRWYGGRSFAIIQIKDPKNTTIKFNTDYDIICNDIEIDPSVSSVKFKENGTIVCKKLIRTKD